MGATRCESACYMPPYCACSCLQSWRQAKSCRDSGNEKKRGSSSRNGEYQAMCTLSKRPFKALLYIFQRARAHPLICILSWSIGVGCVQHCRFYAVPRLQIFEEYAFTEKALPLRYAVCTCSRAKTVTINCPIACTRSEICTHIRKHVGLDEQGR